MSLTKRLVTGYVIPELGVATGFAVFVIGSLAIAVPLSWLSWRMLEVHFAAALRRMVVRKPVLAGAVGVH